MARYYIGGTSDLNPTFESISRAAAPLTLDETGLLFERHVDRSVGLLHIQGVSPAWGFPSTESRDNRLDHEEQLITLRNGIRVFIRHLITEFD